MPYGKRRIFYTCIHSAKWLTLYRQVYMSSFVEIYLGSVSDGEVNCSLQLAPARRSTVMATARLTKDVR